MQESNSFAPALATFDDFQIRYGQQLVEAFQNTNSEIAGLLDGCTEQDWKPVPLMSAHAISGGALSRACFERIAGELVDAVRAQQLDALLVALHGAMSTERFVSGDAEIARRLRTAIGQRIPIVVTHDFHANVQPLLLESVDGVTGYRTYPHVDQNETGKRACRLLARVFDGQSTVRWRLPLPTLLSPQSSSTFEEPLGPVMAALERSFPEEQGSYASIFCVQPWLDFTPVYGTVVVTECEPQESTARLMIELARRLWNIRREFKTDWIQPDDLMGRVRAEANRPVLVCEGHDSPTGGAAGDHTGLLSLLLPHAAALKCCLFLIDSAFVRQARSLGAGAVIEADLGAKVDSRYSRPVRIRATIERLSDGDFVCKGPAFHGRTLSMGETAVLAIKGMRIVVGSKPVMMIDPELYRSQGVEPAGQDVVGIKSPLLFRPAYEPISKTILYLDMAGPCQGRLEAVPYRRINRPIFPLDDFEWSPAAPERAG